MDDDVRGREKVQGEGLCRNGILDTGTEKGRIDYENAEDESSGRNTSSGEPETKYYSTERKRTSTFRKFKIPPRQTYWH